MERESEGERRNFFSKEGWPLKCAKSVDEVGGQPRIASPPPKRSYVRESKEE